ncbi:ABC transporter ATP-binding protein [Marinigracilibium pacificum]|uniref:ABC transporter ATP-binding protein n=1 Tax=Marinigracilibium pacificum TaxID=2729599 RepID=A0A848IWW5_9BACT|nr:ABC transporter ATP-binding protein [Marinigracilibium pacificum]NMM48156.1 ABC transporter ATP-binding protein [Marinigracilibium pacificum]
MTDILRVQKLKKVYNSGDHALTILHDINFTIKKGSSCAIIGPSGSGKTTLLGLCAGLDSVTEGIIELDGYIINEMTEDQRAELRNREVGFVFQSFNLIQSITALENVAIPLELLGKKHALETAMEWLDRVGLADRASHYPSQLSGGEQQRVAIARAFSNEPKILFADEPTGNLDIETGKKIEDLIFQMNTEQGTTLVTVTHDQTLANKADRILEMKGGSIVSDKMTQIA